MYRKDVQTIFYISLSKRDCCTAQKSLLHVTFQIIKASLKNDVMIIYIMTI